MSKSIEANKDTASEGLAASIRLLKEQFNLLENLRSLPSTTLSRERKILQEMGDVQAEILSQELLRLHIRRVNTKVGPPSNESGKALADALEKLQQMRTSTDQFVLFMNLAAGVISSLAAHRREVDTRTTN